MAGKGEDGCLSCSMKTKYICIRCKVHCCTKCSEMESNEDISGWKAGKSVGYCEECSLNILDEQSDQSENETLAQLTHDQPSESCSEKQHQKRLKTKIDSFKKLINCDASDEDDEKSIPYQKNRGKSEEKEKRKPGRKSNWSSDALDDFVDIIVNNSYYQKKLIFTNTKNQKNGQIYEKILSELQERCTKRGELISFSVSQLRIKFKKCVSECKQAALVMKTATGIKRFQEERGFGKWFNPLFGLVKSRDSYKPELALEPSSLEELPTNSTTINDNNGKEGLFIPIKTKKVSTNEKLSEAAIETMNVVKEHIKNDPTKDLITFLREEMDKSREHKLKLVELMQNFQQSSTTYQIPHQLSYSGTPRGEAPSLPANYSMWNIQVGGQNQSPMSQQNADISCSSITGECTPTNIHYDGRKTYRKL